MRNKTIAKTLRNRVLRRFSSLSLAVWELLILGAFSSIGTIFDRGAFDNDKIHDDKTFFWSEVIVNLQLDKIYTNPLYYFMIVALGFSLLACTITRQLPMLRIAQRWRFPTTRKRVLSLPTNKSLPGAKLKDLGRLLERKGYQIFLQNNALYAFKGLAGRYAPILVHAALILILIGTSFSAAGGWKGSVMLPEYQDALVLKYISPATALAKLPRGAKAVIHVNEFSVEYLDNGQITQFLSDLSLFDLDGNEVLRKQIFVNEPLRFEGLTVYQTDWSMASLVVSVKGSSSITADVPVSLQLAPLESKVGVSGKAWGTLIPTVKSENFGEKGVSIVARDFQSVAVYDSKGNIAGVRRIGSQKPIKVEGIELVVLDIIGSTGLELKSDPGVPIVYVGFGFLIITSFLSSVSFSQIWALQENAVVFVGGENKKMPLQFAAELGTYINSIPEYIAK